ncbi:MAG TPA: HEAT repeat domain-containing protein [Kofleriaceae bacterium]|nr:HEAT repeat domain-containing protein [Kofleriaceae bacterium]
MTTNLSKLLAVAAGSFLFLAVPSAHAGRGSNLSRVTSAVASGGSLTIRAELEQAERLLCPGCVTVIEPLLRDDRYEVREVAAWWFARRPAEKKALTEQSITALQGGDTVAVRNAADIVGTFRHPVAVPALNAAYARSGLGAEARLAIVRALGTIGVQGGNATLQAAMADTDAGVRYQALVSWQAIRQQANAQPALPLIGDADVNVRRKAAAVVGGFRDAGGRAALETVLLNDSDPVVRRNAAWALGRIGDVASTDALVQAASDPSPLVRLTARAARRQLR